MTRSTDRPQEVRLIPLTFLRHGSTVASDSASPNPHKSRRTGFAWSFCSSGVAWWRGSMGADPLPILAASSVPYCPSGVVLTLTRCFGGDA